MGLPVTTAFGQDAASTNPDFELRRDHLRQRYADFYIMLNDKDRREVERQRQTAEMRKERAKFLEEREKARRDFVKNRKPRVEASPLTQEKELEQQKLARMKALEEYKRNQRRLREIENQVGQIPDWIEYELYETSEASEVP